MATGWIKIHRGITNHWLYLEPRKFSRFEAWNDILLTVNYAPYKSLIKGKLIEINRGESILSLESWAKRWGWDKTAVRRFLELLKKDGMIEYKSETVTTRLIVCNYDDYQADETKSETQVKRRRHAKETQTTPIKEEEEEEEEKDSNRMLESEQSVSKSIHPLCLWIKEKLPNVSKIKNQLTNEEAERLVTEFSKDAIAEKLEAMENKAKCSTLYVSVNLTVRQWIGRERKSNPNYGLKSNTSNPNNIEFTLEEKARLCRQYGIKFEYGDTNFIVPPQMTDEEKVAYRKLFDYYKEDGMALTMAFAMMIEVGVVQFVKNKNL